MIKEHFGGIDLKWDVENELENGDTGVREVNQETKIFHCGVVFMIIMFQAEKNLQ